MAVISVIVPVYRVQNSFLRKCIESIIYQSFEDIEIILVDDGSPDNCGSICDEYAQKDERIRVIHKQNEGLSAARNTGFQSASGDWIMFVDGDDWIETNTCKVMLDAGKEMNAQLVMCKTFRDYNGTLIKHSYDLKDGYLYKDKECRYLQEQVLMFHSNIASVYAKLIRRNYLIENNIRHNAKLRQGAEGIEFCIRLFEKLESAVMVDHYLYHYIYNDNSISASHNEENHKLVLSCFEEIKKIIKTSDISEKLIDIFYNRMLYIIITTAITGYFNPTNSESYIVKKEKYRIYLANKLVKESIEYNNIRGLSMERKMALFMIKHKLFFVLNIMAKLRYEQKRRKNV